MEKVKKTIIDDEKNKKKFEFEIFKQEEALTNLTIDEYIKLNSAKNIHVAKKNENYFEKRKTLFWR